MRVGNFSVVSVCVSVYLCVQTIIFETHHIETCFVYIFNITTSFQCYVAHTVKQAGGLHLTEVRSCLLTDLYEYSRGTQKRVTRGKFKHGKSCHIVLSVPDIS